MVVVGGPGWLLPHPIAPPASAMDKATSSKPPRRRLRGRTRKSREAKATPEPAATHGIRPGAVFPGRLGTCKLASVKLGMLSVVATEAEELTVTVAGLKVRLGT